MLALRELWILTLVFEVNSLNHFPCSTGIGPETFAWISSDGNFTGGNPPDAGDLAFYAEHGFYVLNGGSDYILRPEVLESNFYAFRVTGDVKYLERARAAANSLNKFTQVNKAFAGINNVTEFNSGFIDDTESFFFAEVMKYLYVHVQPYVPALIHLHCLVSSHLMTRSISTLTSVRETLSLLSDLYS